MAADIKKFLVALGPDAEVSTTKAMTTTEETPVAEKVDEPPVVSEAVASSFLEFISKGEGGYESSNRGTKGGRIIGSTHDTVRDGKPLSSLTIQEIMDKQDLGIDDEDRLFAVGKYQLIPDTFEMAVNSLGLSGDTVFSPEVQEQLGQWLLFKKRPRLGAYIKGDHSDLNLALREAAKEWASLPDPSTGNSYYGEGNRAQHSVAQTTSALKAARESYLNQFAPTSSPVPPTRPTQ